MNESDNSNIKTKYFVNRALFEVERIEVFYDPSTNHDYPYYDRSYAYYREDELWDNESDAIQELYSLLTTQIRELRRKQFELIHRQMDMLMEKWDKS